MVQLSHPYMTTGKTSFDYTDLHQQMMSLPFNMLSVCHSSSSKEQSSFIFMAVVTICSDFGAQENKVCHCFHFFPSICHEKLKNYQPLHGCSYLFTLSQSDLFSIILTYTQFCSTPSCFLHNLSLIFAWLSPSPFSGPSSDVNFSKRTF